MIRPSWPPSLLTAAMLWLAGCGGEAVLPPPLAGEMNRSLLQGEKLYRKGEWHKALSEYQQALLLARVRQDQVSEISALLSIGHLEGQLDQLASSQKHLQEALTLANTPEVSHLAAEARLGLARNFLQQGELAAAGELFAPFLAEPAAGIPPHQRLAAWNGQALIHKAQGALSSGEQLLAQAEQLAKTLHLPQSLAATHLNQSVLAQAGNRLDEATTLVRQALAIYRQQEDLPGMAACSLQLARLARQTRHQNEAMDWESRAREIRAYLTR